MFVFFIGIVFYFRDILIVPFHPDESTQIFMSSDVDLIADGQLSHLFYTDVMNNNLRQTYRLLDSPITKYLIGFVRKIFNQPSIAADWDWSKTWQENQSSLPSDSILLFSRLSVASLFPATLLFYFFLWKEIFNQRIAILGTLFFATNSLILLHTRRAMAESGLLFSIGLSMLVLWKLPRKYIFLSAIPIALAINTKQSLVPLIIIAIIMIFYKFREIPFYKFLFSVLTFSIIFLSFSYLLNPIVWKQPIKASLEMVSQRAQLTERQIAAIENEAPEFILDTPVKKTIGLLGQSFITKPAYQDIANYQNELLPQIKKYQSIFLYSGYGRTLFFGVLNFILCSIGLVTVILTKEFKHILFITSFFLFLGEILLFFSIPFQRYYLPLFPFFSIFLSNGIFILLNKIKKLSLISGNQSNHYNG